VEASIRSKMPGGEEGALVYLALLRKGNAEEVERYRERLGRRLSQIPMQENLYRQSLRLTQAMYEQDLADMRDAASLMPEPPRQQLLNAIAFDEGSDPECKTVLGSSNELSPILQKLLTSFRKRELNLPFAESREEAVTLMRSPNAPPGILPLFEKGPQTTIEDVDQLTLQNRERGILLIALAFENPSQKEAMLRYARRLLAIPQLPQKCLDDWIKQGLGE
jgi:hypothetical protein